jgi:uncharacterized protein (TIGR00645 family)
LNESRAAGRQMKRVTLAIESVLFASRFLLVPVYIAMILLLGMLVFFFLLDIAHALPDLLRMTENNLLILTLSLIDLSLAANLVVLVVFSGYENFVSSIHLSETTSRPEWLTKIDFSGLKLKLLGSMTVIAAVHLLASFLELDQQDDRNLGWQVGIVVVFALLGLIFAITDKIGDKN